MIRLRARTDAVLVAMYEWCARTTLCRSPVSVEPLGGLLRVHLCARAKHHRGDCRIATPS